MSGGAAAVTTRLDPRVVLALAGILCLLAVWFGTLDARHLVRSDEGRYAEISREMVESGDWVTPRYNGLKYFEKPPLHFWATSIVYRLFGLGEWQARLWVALCGAVGLAAAALAAWRWWGPRAGLAAGLVLLATPAWNLGAHFNSLDMGVSAALAAVMAGVMLSRHPGARPAVSRRWAIVTWAAMAVAVLSKGLIGIVLPAAVLVVYTLWSRDYRIWRHLHPVAGLATFLAIAAPWFCLVSYRNPEFAPFFFIHEHLQRYTSEVHQRGAPWWYFVPRLAAGFLPWLGLAAAMVGVVRRERDTTAGFRPAKWLVSWATVIFLFFSASGSKLPGYILPVLPALAVLAGVALTRLSPEAWARQLKWALAVVLVLAVAAPFVSMLSSSNTPRELYAGYAVWLSAAATWLVVGALAALSCAHVGRHALAIAVYGVTMFLGATVCIVGHETIGRASSGVDLVPRIQRVLTPSMPLYGVRMLDHTLPFYLRRPLTMVEAPDELAFGVRQEPAKWVPTMAEFRRRWVTGPDALAVMSQQTYLELLATDMPMTIVAHDARRMVVSNATRNRP